MPSLLSLPRELRDQIWAYTCHREHTWSSYGLAASISASPSDANAFQSVSFPAILQTSRRVCCEVTPFLYETIYVSVVHPSQVTRWLGSIGPTNCSCIRHLVIRFTSLLLNYNQGNYVRDRMSAWDATLRSLPKLLSLTFDFELDPRVSMIWGTFDDSMLEKEMLVNDTIVGDEIVASATAWTNLLHPTKVQACENQSKSNDRPVRHAFVATDEAIPPLLLQYFQTLLRVMSKSTFEQKVTGFPIKSFADSAYYLARTYVSNDSPENPSFGLSFGKRQRNPSSPLTTLRVMLNQLPHLLYLRVRGRNIDSSFMTCLPTQVQTLDVAFMDLNPHHLATNLQIMRGRCERLFTLAIAVSPLHDRNALGHSVDKVFSRKSISKHMLDFWGPFWEELEHLKRYRCASVGG